MPNLAAMPYTESPFTIVYCIGGGRVFAGSSVVTTDGGVVA